MALEKITTSDLYNYDVLIVGGGPGGLAAAIYCRKANLKVGFIEKSVPGGKMVNTPKIENYPGFKSIAGADLALQMYEHATSLEAEYIYGNVTGINQKLGYQVVYTEDGLTRYAKVLILATGTIDKKLDIPGWTKYALRGISHCAVCDGTLAKNKTVAIIGGGETALENAEFISTLARKVYLINGSGEFANPKVASTIQNNIKNVEFVLNSNVEEFLGDEQNINGIRIINKLTNQSKVLDLDFVFVNIGSTPSTQFLDGLNILNADNLINVDSRQSTIIPGLFAIGDVTRKTIRQITTATSDATVASIEAVKYIKENFSSNK